jgi:hypothetical protein
MRKLVKDLKAGDQVGAPNFWYEVVKVLGFHKQTHMFHVRVKYKDGGIGLREWDGDTARTFEVPLFGVSKVIDD